MNKNFDAITILNIAYDLLICLSSIHNEKIVQNLVIIFGIFFNAIKIYQI